MGCKTYDRAADRYTSRVLLHHPYLKKRVIKVPRIAPPMHKLAELKGKIEATLGVESAENGRLAFRSFDVVLQQLLAQDPGTQQMPALPFFLGGAAKLPIVISYDCTGFGSQQLNTIALRNPYLSASAQHLRVFGLGNCSDDRSGTTRLLGSNLKTINSMIDGEQCIPCPSSDDEVSPEVFLVLDVSALRHSEHLANSGWCGCSCEFALRSTPPRPTSVLEMYELLKPHHHHVARSTASDSEMNLTNMFFFPTFEVEATHTCGEHRDRDIIILIVSFNIDKSL